MEIVDVELPVFRGETGKKLSPKSCMTFSVFYVKIFFNSCEMVGTVCIQQISFI